MGVDGEKKNRSKKGSKKARKDKWGQPIVSEESVAVAAAAVAEYQEQEAEQQQHQQEESFEFEPNKVVVSGMPYSASEDEIRDIFKDIGPIVQLQLSRFPDSGNFRGLAFVTFQTEAMAASSLKLDGFKMENRFIKIERCRLDPGRKRKSDFLSEPKKVDGCFSAYVGNLSWEITEDHLRDCFEESKIVSIRFATDRRTGQSRGFCHIDFEDDESLENAVKKNQEELHGRPMKIAYAVSNRN